MSFREEHIPELLKDPTTIVKNHTLKTYIFCVLIRITLGLLIITNKIPKNILIINCLFIIIGFSYKFYKLEKVWKVYLRTILVYTIVLGLTLIFNNQYNQVSGSLIIIDALMGLQSRHIFDRIGLLYNSKI
jgi:hypothetical protein